MDIYVVKICNIRSSKLHPSLRNEDFERWHAEDEDALYDVYLSPTGRLCSYSSAAYLSTKPLAESLLDHYLPTLKARNYGDVEFKIDKARGTKWDIRRLERSEPKVIDLLGLAPGVA